VWPEQNVAVNDVEPSGRANSRSAALVNPVRDWGEKPGTSCSQSRNGDVGDWSWLVGAGRVSRTTPVHLVGLGWIPSALVGPVAAPSSSTMAAVKTFP
jgi:hypothetical protein